MTLEISKSPEEAERARRYTKASNKVINAFIREREAADQRVSQIVAKKHKKQDHENLHKSSELRKPRIDQVQSQFSSMSCGNVAMVVR
jgi:hypothetical protein